MLQYALLWLFHLVLALKRFISTLLPRRQPRPLRTRRRKVPEHLAVILRSEGTSEDAKADLLDALESVKRLVEWSKVAGIRTLSVFDEAGVLLESWERIHDVLGKSRNIVNVSVSKGTEYPRNGSSKDSTLSSSLRLPLTPPLSKTASASSLRSSSPDSHIYSRLPGEQTDTKSPRLVTFQLFDSHEEDGIQETTKSLTLYVLSKDMGKPQLARVAREMASSAFSEQKKGRVQASSKASVSVSSLRSRLEDDSWTDGWPCPDLLLIYSPATSRQAQLSPLEFGGFPPWQIHLTEVAYIPPKLPQTEFLRRFWSIPKRSATSITEHAFRVALDEYDGAEMRFGK